MIHIMYIALIFRSTLFSLLSSYIFKFFYCYFLLFIPFYFLFSSFSIFSFPYFLRIKKEERIRLFCTLDFLSNNRLFISFSFFVSIYFSIAFVSFCFVLSSFKRFAKISKA